MSQIPQNGDHLRLPSRTLDVIASRAKGWKVTDHDLPPINAGLLAYGEFEFHDRLKAFVDEVRNVRPELLKSINNLIEVPLSQQPLVENPSDEPLVVIDPSRSNETGIIPRAAYWQSGWDNALGYVFVRKSVLEKLERVAMALREIDPEITIHLMDGWRSIDQQRELYDTFYPDGYNEGDPLYVSPPQTDDRYAAPHPSGGAVDIFFGFGDSAVNFGSPYDDFEPVANTDHYETLESPDASVQDFNLLVRDLRRIMTNLMHEQDFIVVDSEWWHFEFGTRRHAAFTGQDAIYGNAVVTPELYEGIEQVSVNPGSARELVIKQASIGDQVPKLGA